MLFAVNVFAQSANGDTQGSGIEWDQLLLVIGYLGGIFILLPIVIYTNTNETITQPDNIDRSDTEYVAGLSEEERNQKAQEILDRIEEILTPVETDAGENFVTITKGSQAKFIKRGLDYINKKLIPTNEAVKERVEEFTEVYNNRSKRIFTGSKFVIFAAIAVGIIPFLSGSGFTTFIIIHALGIIFYVLASRTPEYTLEKRAKFIKGSFLSGILSGLFLGEGTKYYKRSGGGFWRRDWETEGMMAIIKIFLMLIVIIFLGFFASLLGIVNFFLNYSTSLFLPFKTLNKWYAINFE